MLPPFRRGEEERGRRRRGADDDACSEDTHKPS